MRFPRFLPGRFQPRTARPRSYGWRRGAWLALPFAGFAAVWAATAVAVSDVPRGMAGELYRTGLRRTAAPRLSSDSVYAPCTVRLPADGTVPAGPCRAGLATATGALLELSARAAAADTSNPDAAQTLALLDLRDPAADATVLRRSIESLGGAAAGARHPALLLSDLAAAHLRLAQAEQSPREVLEALDAAARAVEADPGSRAARFNLSLALDWLAVDGEARLAWEGYVAIDPTSPWADEARGRIAALHPPSPRPAPTAESTEAEVDAFAVAAPQDARVLGWEVVLPRWGQAVQAGRPDSAEAALRLAERLGDALERRGGDATLADAVRAIHRAAGDARATGDLAAAHAAYGAGRHLYGKLDYLRARALYARTLRGPSAPLRAWLAWEDLARRGSGDSTKQALAQAVGGVQAVDGRRYPALAGRREWIYGTLLSKSGFWDEAVAHYQDADRLFARAGEEENRGTVEYLAGEARYSVGDVDAGIATLHRGLLRLRAYPASRWRRNALDVLARAAADRGLDRAVGLIGSESVRTARATGISAYVTESRLMVAQLRTRAGKAARVRADLADSAHILPAVADPSTRSFLEADRLLAHGIMEASADPRAAERQLSETLPGLANRPVLAYRARLARAVLRLRRHDPNAALADLDIVLAAMAENRKRPNGSAGLSPTEAAPVVDAAVRGLVDAGRPVDALALLERHRTVLAAAGPHDPWLLRAIRPALPGASFVRLAAIGDSVYAWALSNDTLRFARTRVRAADVAETVERVRTELAEGADDPASVHLARLYGWLLRPVAPALGGMDREVVILADGALAGVPWAALRDGSAGPALVQRHPLRMGAGIAEAWTPAPPPPAGPRPKVLLVADPAFDAAANPGLHRLPGAGREVDSLQRVYPAATVLRGADATPSALAAGLRGAAVVHFAGHAVANPNRPARSVLVLAPEPGGGGSGALSAAGLDNLDARGIRLVVLSACETQDPSRTGAGQLAGLSGAFLGAGAQGVVGSLWPVRDDATRALMVAFHRRYAATGNAAASLRGAQVEMMGSADPRHRSPGVWAAFQLAGR